MENTFRRGNLRSISHECRDKCAFARETGWTARMIGSDVQLARSYLGDEVMHNVIQVAVPAKFAYIRQVLNC